MGQKETMKKEKEKKSDPAEQERDLESSLKRIEEIIDALEQPGVTLVDSLNLYKEGVLLASQCKEAITDVEREIEVLKTQEDL